MVTIIHYRNKLDQGKEAMTDRTGSPTQQVSAWLSRFGAALIRGVQQGVFKNRGSWLEQKPQDEADLGYATQPYCVIVGGGQGGIALAARLKRLEVPTLIIKKNNRPGDSWRKRYKSLCL